MDTIVKNRELNMVISNRMLLMNIEKFKEDGLDLNTVFVTPVNRSMIPKWFKFDEYVKDASRGVQSQKMHEEFLKLVHEPYDRNDNDSNGFWWGNDTSDRPQNLIETYSKRFTDCFGERGRNLVTAPAVIREILDRIYVNGETYHKYYGVGQINMMNFMEVVCEVIDNLSRGDIARSFAKSSTEKIIVTYKPVGKNHINVYLPVNAFTELEVEG